MESSACSPSDEDVTSLIPFDLLGPANTLCQSCQTSKPQRDAEKLRGKYDRGRSLEVLRGLGMHRLAQSVDQTAGVRGLTFTRSRQRRGSKTHRKLLI